MGVKRKDRSRDDGDVATTSRGASDGEKPKRKKAEESAEPKGLEIYWKLSSNNTGDRQAAAIALVKELQAAQQSYESKPEEDILLGSNEKMQGCAPEIQYALPRLVRGVASSNQGARQGFSLALTAVCTTEKSITGDLLLNLIENEINISSSMKSQELKDGLLGKLFCYAAVVRAERFLGKAETKEQVELVQKISQELLKLAQKKSFLREAATCTLLELVDRLPASALQKTLFALPSFAEWLKAAPEVGGSDVLLLAIKVWKLLPAPLLKECALLPKSGAESDLFQASHLEVILPYLKESSSSHPKVHPVWDTLACILANRDSLATTSKKSKRKSQGFASNQCLVTFWNTVIDETLLFSSHERKHLAMRLVLLFLSKLPTAYIPIVVSNAFGRCLLDALSSPKNLLHSSAQQFVSDLCSWAEQDEDRLVPVIASLQQCSGGKFDHSTNTSTVKNLTNGVRSADSCLSAIQNVRDMFLNDTSSGPDNSEEEGKAVRREIWMVELLYSFCKLPSASISASKEVLKFLVAHVLASSASADLQKLKKLLKWTPKSLPKPVEEACVLKLRALLGEKIHTRTEEDQETEDCAFFVVEFFRAALKPTKDGELEEEDVQAALHSAISQLTTAILDKKEAEKRNRYKTMRSLLSQLVIQSWLEPGSVDEVATELVICCKKAFANVINVPFSTEEEDTENSPPVIDVLLDVVLSLLSQASAPIRKAAEQLFFVFSSDITASGINTMLKVVTKQLGNRINEIFDAEADDDDDEDVVDIEDVSDDEKSDTEEPESGLESEEEQGNDANVEDDTETSDLDDEAMFRIDSQLAGILKQRKKGTGDGQTQLVEFKFRVLGLLESFLVRQSSSPLLVLALPQLFQAYLDAGVGGNKNLADRIRAIMDKTFKAKHYPRGPGVDETAVKELLPKVLLVVSRTRDKSIRALAQTFVFWLFKVRLAISEDGTAEVGQIVSSALELAFDNKKSKLHIGFIMESLTRIPWLGSHLIGQLLEKSKSVRSDHYKVEAMNVVSSILKPYTKPGASLDAEFTAALEKQLGALSEVFVLHLNKPMPSTDKQAGFLRFCATGLGALPALFPNRPLTKLVDTGAVSAALSGFKASAKGKLKPLAENIERLLEGRTAAAAANKSSNKRKQDEALETAEPGTPTTEERVTTPKSKKQKPAQAAAARAAARAAAAAAASAAASAAAAAAAGP